MRFLAQGTVLPGFDHCILLKYILSRGIKPGRLVAVLYQSQTQKV
jgi:hypothetical protein